MYIPKKDISRTCGNSIQVFYLDVLAQNRGDQMKKKIIILLIMVLLLTGCTAEYNLRINFNGTVSENFSFLVDQSVAKFEGMGETPQGFVDGFADVINAKSGSGKYHISKIIDNGTMGFNVSKNYKDLKRYIMYSSFAAYLFSDMKTTTNGTHVILESVGSFKEAAINCEWCGYPKLDNSYIAVSLPYKVVKSNANRVDEKTNTYYWDLKYNQHPDSFYLEYDKAFLFSYNLFAWIPYLNYYLLGLIIIIIITGIMVWYFYRKQDKINEI